MFIDSVTSRIGAGVGDAVADRFKRAVNDADAAVRAQGRASMGILELEHEAMELAGDVKTAEELAESSLPFWGGLVGGSLIGVGVACSIARE